MIRKQIYLSSEIDRHLKRLAQKDGRKESEIIREALAEYMTRYVAPADLWAGMIGMVKDGAPDEVMRVDEIVYSSPGGNDKT